VPTVFESPDKAANQTTSTVNEAKTIGLNPMKPFAAYASHPQGVRFETQEEEETVELFLRQHPIVNVAWICTSILMLIAPTVLFPLLSKIIPFNVPIGYVIVGTFFWYIATFGFILSNFMYWFFNIFIVSNERIVDIDFYFLLYKHFTQAELQKIQDISFTTSGLLATIFDYGDVVVQTAGEMPEIRFESVPHPQKVVEVIRALTEKIYK
jgi:uncharacterized membrane protein YdbT with pleckstrin-like domain